MDSEAVERVDGQTRWLGHVHAGKVVRPRHYRSKVSQVRDRNYCVLAGSISA
jgi:hypothetical protein